MRKKVSTDENNLGQIDLDEDEAIVVENTTTKRIRRERKPAAAEPEPTPEPDDDFIDVELDDTGEYRPQYADDSLAALIFAGDDAEPNIDEEYCSVAIRRHPDEIHDAFAKPCLSVTNLPRLSGVSIATRKPDIEERTRKLYGGGRYFFQMHYNGRLCKSWTSVLADDPNAIMQSAAAAVEPRPASNPIDDFLDGLEKQKRLRELLYGDQENEMRRKIEELSRELKEARDTPAAPPSEKLAIIETALKIENDDIQRRLLDRVFPSEPTGERSAVADVIDVVLNNTDKIMPFVQSVLGGLMPPLPPTPGASQPAPAAGIDALLSQPRPDAAPLPAPTTAWRRNPDAAEPEPEPLDAEPAEPEPAAVDTDTTENEVSDAAAD